MSGTVAIVVFFTGLLFIILIHEAGHYLVARAYGFKVEEYFVGFGPKIWSFRRNDIEYGVKALPLGGYVKIAGMNPYEPVAPEDLHRSYGAKPIRQRALVILAGPGSHFIVAAILFASWLFFFGDPRTPTPYITSVETTLNGQVGPGVGRRHRAGRPDRRRGRHQRPDAGRAVGVHDGPRQRAGRVHGRARAAARSRW